MITDQSKLEAVERELGYRRRVYAKRVEAKQMRASLANYQIEIFEAIRDDYLAKVEGARLL